MAAQWVAREGWTDFYETEMDPEIYLTVDRSGELVDFPWQWTIQWSPSDPSIEDRQVGGSASASLEEAQRDAEQAYVNMKEEGQPTDDMPDSFAWIAWGVGSTRRSSFEAALRSVLSAPLQVQPASPTIGEALSLVLDSIVSIYAGETIEQGERTALATCLGALLSANTTPAMQVVEAIIQGNEVTVI